MVTANSNPCKSMQIKTHLIPGAKGLVAPQHCLPGRKPYCPLGFSLTVESQLVLRTYWRSGYWPQPLHLHWTGGSRLDTDALTQLSHHQLCGHAAASIMQTTRSPNLTETTTTLKTEGKTHGPASEEQQQHSERKRKKAPWFWRECHQGNGKHVNKWICCRGELN